MNPDKIRRQALFQIARDFLGINWNDLSTLERNVGCNLQPHEHKFYNCDLFNGMLQRSFNKAWEGMQWYRLNELPKGIKVIEGKFLSEVQTEIEV